MIGNWDGEHIRLNHLAILHLHLVTEASNAEDMLVPDLQYWMAGLVSMEDQDLDTIEGFLTLAAGPPSKCCRDEAIAVRC